MSQFIKAGRGYVDLENVSVFSFPTLAGQVPEGCEHKCAVTMIFKSGGVPFSFYADDEVLEKINGFIKDHRYKREPAGAER